LITKGYNGHCGDAVTAENPPIKELWCVNLVTIITITVNNA